MASHTDRSARRVRVLTCNILAGARVQHYHEYATRCWGAVLPGAYKDRNLERLGQEAADFDIVGLQETDPGSLRSGFGDQTRRLALAAGLPHWVDQGNRHWRGIAHTANGLISRTTPCDVQRHVLPGRGRGLLVVRYGEALGGLVVAVAHLSLGQASQVRQAARIVQVLDGEARVLLMGDMNCDGRGAALGLLHQAGGFGVPVAEPATFPSWRPRRVLDHILVRGDLRVARRWTLPAMASDHLPLAAEVEIPAAA